MQIEQIFFDLNQLNLWHSRNPTVWQRPKNS